jgi:DNA-binding NtrC family response regulator
MSAAAKARILIVDDDAAIRETLAEHLAAEGYETCVAESAEQALNRLHEFDPAIVISDVRMGGMTGIELTARVRDARPETHVVVITAHEDMETAVGAMRAGAFDLLVKPLDLGHIELLLERCLQDRALRRSARHYVTEAAEPYTLPRLVGRDPRMLAIYKLIGAVAPTRTPVLIRGETGTGKEVIARAIHYNSERAAEPFVAINCTALPEGLLESELFGHVRGAFTGATQDRRGRFELAGAGTLFLDEIGDTGTAFQAKLLRVLQEREFEPVGSERTRRTEARVIAATHRPLEQCVRDGTFREDLYFRLRVIEIDVPPLRQRRGDIPLLARHLLARIAGELHRPLQLTPEVEAALVAHDWPGNVRELENALTRAAVLARGSAIALENLAPARTPPRGGSPPDAAAAGASAAGASVAGASLAGASAAGASVAGASVAGASVAGASVAGASVAGASLAGAAAAGSALADVERRHIVAVLRGTGGNKRHACRILRISRPRLDRLIARHGIVAAEYDARGIEA